MTPTTNSTEKEEGWVEHCGHDRPSIQVEVRLRDGRIEQGNVESLEWWFSEDEPESDIVAFRVVEAA